MSRLLSEQDDTLDHPIVPPVSRKQREPFDEGGRGDEGVTFFE